MTPHKLRLVFYLWCVVVLAAWVLQQPWAGLVQGPAGPPPPPDALAAPASGTHWGALLQWLGRTALFCGGFLLANLCIGSALLPLLARTGGALERFVLSFALGTVVSGLALFALALAGLFSPTAVLVLGGGCVAAGLVAWLRRRGRAADEPVAEGEGDPEGVPRALEWAALLAMAGVALLLLLRCAVPDLDLDSVQFHRVAINQIVRTGGLEICWENYAANRPLQLELFQAVAFDDRSASASIQALFTFLTGLAVAAVLWRRVGPALALSGAALYLLDQSVLWRAAMHANENAMAFYTVVGLGALANHLEGRGEGRGRSWGWAALGGLFIGFSVGTYYIALLSVASSAVALIAVERLGGRQQRKRWLTFALVAGAALSPWLLRNLVQLGNPVYPLLYHWFGGRGLFPTAELLHTALGDFLFLERNPAWLVLLLFGVPRGELFNALMLVFWPAGVARRRVIARLLALWALGYFLLWFVLMPQDRFLIPVKGVLAALAALGAHAVFLRLDRRTVRWLCAALALLLLAVLGARWSADGPMVRGALGRVLGEGDSRPALRSGYLERVINTELPAGARVAGISSGFLRRPALAILPVGFFDISKMQNAAGVATELARFRITHLVTPRRGTMARRFWSAADAKDPRVRKLVDGALAGMDAFQREHCASVRRAGEHDICAIRP